MHIPPVILILVLVFFVVSASAEQNNPEQKSEGTSSAVTRPRSLPEVAVATDAGLGPGDFGRMVDYPPGGIEGSFQILW